MIFSRIWSAIKSRDFWIGYSQAFNLFPVREDYYPHKSVADAIVSDWRAVGKDMWKVIGELERKIEEGKP